MFPVHWDASKAEATKSPEKDGETSSSSRKKKKKKKSRHHHEESDHASVTTNMIIPNDGFNFCFCMLGRRWG